MAKKATFDVELMDGCNVIDVGTFTYKDTVLKVKQCYYDNINNSMTVDKLRFMYMGRIMDNHQKLGYYDNDVESSMIIMLTHQICGGGGGAPKAKKSTWAFTPKGLKKVEY
mmetsp:Transcript_98491/g.120619  ORF Transcript_98491/g.120619 Transcript_98491/m.120619 type:complete len:111 (+) Transcript_98491:95-427(+)|eukprot:CAMPEP_0114657946 /NCGR_PEP_ID=MMETSP0191-20121206/14849_1 /TAXON_ID=126664 /ORGANISM="Sorites sp." /LENGTH=110 /DNA_ID=CAMNT_0001878663 /DNA_START=62 /DNA_END=394 /DNA_ORIENTATION=+